MNDMRELLSGALPAPQDEPQQRDVIDAAMNWGARRRRRDWALSGAAALAVIAVGTGVAAMSGGSGNNVASGSGARPSSSTQPKGMPSEPAGSWWTPYCNPPNGHTAGTLADYCRLFNEEQNYNLTFTQGAVQYIQRALPAGFTVKKTSAAVLILTGPNGKTNYLFPSAEPASTLDGRPLSCGTPPQPGCLQTSTDGGTLVVNSAPSGDPSAGYVKDGLTDPRIDILLGTSVTGGLNGAEPPTSATPLLSNAQLAKVISDPGFVAYAKEQVQHLKDITKQLQTMAPPSPSGSISSIVPPTGLPTYIGAPSGSLSGMPTNSSGQPSGYPSSGPTDSFSSSPGYPASSSGDPASESSSS